MGGPGDLPRIPFAFQVGFGIQHYAATVRLDAQLVLLKWLEQWHVATKGLEAAMTFITRVQPTWRQKTQETLALFPQSPKLLTTFGKDHRYYSTPLKVWKVMDHYFSGFYWYIDHFRYIVYWACYRETIWSFRMHRLKLRTDSCDGFLEKNADRLPLETVAGGGLIRWLWKQVAEYKPVKTPPKPAEKSCTTTVFE